jgi:hypothetical protein
MTYTPNMTRHIVQLPAAATGNEIITNQDEILNSNV